MTKLYGLSFGGIMKPCLLVYETKEDIDNYKTIQETYIHDDYTLAFLKTWIAMSWGKPVLNKDVGL